MRDALARLERKRERLWHLRCPFAQHVLLRQSIEGVVDLDRWKLAGVECQHSVVFQLLRIKRAFPLLESVPTRPCEELHDTIRFDSPFSFFGFSLARLAF